MPTSATHITVVQRVAASGAQFRQLLGNPDGMFQFTNPNDPEAVKMRYACLGAVGPDVFYALADYGSELQDLEDFLVKVGGTFRCIGQLSEEIGRYVSGVESSITDGVMDSINETFKLASSVIKDGLLSLLVDSGANFWPIFRPARQRDEPREQWFWADYLHYIRSGRFATLLFDGAKASGNANLMAYACGYLTHYATDVVGHPYVNQVVGAPWRMYWQRHHLVENFIDAYVWPRWHSANPAPSPPTTQEQPLDSLVTSANAVGSGAKLTYARLNDWIGVGGTAAGDPVDTILNSVCTQIQNGLFQIGVAVDFDPTAPNDPDFVSWTHLMAATLRSCYDPVERHPQNLAQGLTPRPGGYPTPDDVASAYGVFRVLLSVMTEDDLDQPEAPTISSDISSAIQQLANDISNALGSIPPVPTPSFSGGFTLDNLLSALEQAAEWALQAGEAIASAVVQFVKDAIAAAGTVVTDAIKYALWVLNSGLFAIYRSFRDVLVLNAYSAPLMDQLTASIGPLAATSLYHSTGDPPQYPHEEAPDERDKFFSDYRPFKPPTTGAEQPQVLFVAPWGPPAGTQGWVAPDEFLDEPLGAQSMFNAQGPEPSDDRGSFKALRRDFGGAVANSAQAIELAVAGFPGGTSLPDYNLDGDRGYAWPCWDVTPAPPAPGTPGPTPDHLDPAANGPAGIATVDAVAVQG